MKLQKYECRLKPSGVLVLRDSVTEQAAERVSGAERLAQVAHALLRDLPTEQVWVFWFGARLDLRGAALVSQGGVHATALTPADVLRPVLVSGCTIFALAHNHPSGDPTPSDNDRTMQRGIYAAAEVVGLSVLDHVIVTQRPGRWHALGSRGEE